MHKKKFIIASLLLAIAPFAAQATELNYIGVVTEPTGSFVALTPAGTFVNGPIDVDAAALDAGLIGIDDINSIDVRVGGFCFATPGGDCAGLGALVPITSIDTAAITGTSGTLGGSFSVTAFSPTFMVSIPILFDLDAGTFFGDGGALGTVSGTGTLEPSVDLDGDGIFDGTDNCTMIVNADQIDSNLDGIGNACDADINNDCNVSFLDIAQFPPLFGAAPGDANYDEDFNVSTANPSINFLDYVVFTGQFNSPPGPSANACVPGLGN